MTAARLALLAAAMTAGLSLAACSGRQDSADTSGAENRELKIAPLKPEAPVAPPPMAVAPKPTPPLSNTLETTKEAANLPPDAQVQEDAAAVGMTSRRTADAGATPAPPVDRPSSMSNLY